MEFFEQTITFLWLISGIIFLFIELINPGLFFFISFFFGSVAAATGSIYVSSVLAQIGIFLGATILSFFGLCRYAVACVEKDRPHHRTNIDALIGRRGFVIQLTDDKQFGLVKVDGITWAAKSIAGQTAYITTTIEVVDVKGAHLIVKNI